MHVTRATILQKKIENQADAIDVFAARVELGVFGRESREVGMGMVVGDWALRLRGRGEGMGCFLQALCKFAC